MGGTIFMRISIFGGNLQEHDFWKEKWDVQFGPEVFLAVRLFRTGFQKNFHYEHFVVIRAVVLAVGEFTY